MNRLQIVNDEPDIVGNNNARRISIIRQYVRDNISEDLSLNVLADFVYFNPTYLSRLFKKQTGTTLISYINNVRVEKAKELLHDPHVKIHDVGVAVGVQSSSYFTQFFKKATGQSPQDYRDSILLQLVIKKSNLESLRVSNSINTE